MKDEPRQTLQELYDTYLERTGPEGSIVTLDEICGDGYTREEARRIMNEMVKYCGVEEIAPNVFHFKGN